LSQLLRLFPSLTKQNHAITSPATSRYNCIAWAAWDSDRWWEPDTFGIYYWPPNVPREATLEAYALAYGTFGYGRCSDSDLEVGFEKVAIFADTSGTPTHATRQLPNGRWTSKCGQLEDIEHGLDGLAGDEYGHVAVILKRPLQRRNASSPS